MHFTCNLSYNGHLTALPPHSYKLVYALDLAGVLTTLTVNDNTLGRQLAFIKTYPCMFSPLVAAFRKCNSIPGKLSWMQGSEKFNLATQKCKLQTRNI